MLWKRFFPVNYVSECVKKCVVVDGLDIFTFEICRLIWNNYFCQFAEINLIVPIWKHAIARIFDSKVGCAKLGFCQFPILVLDSDKDFIRRVLADKPPVKRPHVAPNPNKYKIVVFADPHMDYDYEEVNKCNITLFRDQKLNVDFLFAAAKTVPINRMKIIRQMKKQGNGARSEIAICQQY